uniref:Uncharacterized protein n=1 Tax=Cacopsylla melanoneura TaxID=428564 RepID=A0A8D9BPH5_9HEMI
MVLPFITTQVVLDSSDLCAQLFDHTFHIVHVLIISFPDCISYRLSDFRHKFTILVFFIIIFISSIVKYSIGCYNMADVFFDFSKLIYYHKCFILFQLPFYNNQLLDFSKGSQHILLLFVYLHLSWYIG